MKTYGLVAIIAFGMLSGCSLPRRQLVEKSAQPTEPVASATTEEENLTVAEPLRPVAKRVSRLPFTGDVDEENFVQLASHALQPAQDEEDILPEVLELPVPSDQDELTLYDLEQMALSGNPALGQAAGRVQALQGKWQQVGLPPNPNVGYVAEEMGDDGTAGKQGAFISQEFVMGKKLHLNRAVVSQEIARAEADYATIEQRVRTDVQTAFYNVLLAQRRVAVTRDLVAIAEQAVVTSQDLLKAEEVGKAAVLQSQVEANTAQILLRQAENSRLAAWRQLSSVVGAPDMPMQKVHGELDDVMHDFEFEEVMQRLISSSPQLASAYAQIERARWGLSRAEVEAVPNINAQVVVQHDNATGDEVAGVQIGIPLPLINRNQGGVQQAFGEIVVAEQNVARLELSLRNELAEVFRSYADARVQVEKYGQLILPQAKETLDLTEKGYRAGEMDFLTLLTAQRTYFQTNLNYLDALREYWSRFAEIEGLLLKGSLEMNQ